MSKLIIEEPPLQVLPSLAVAIGLNEAIIVQQIHYWVSGKSGKIIDGKRWIYNGYREWKEQFPFWSEDTIQRAFRNAENQGVVVSMHQKGFDRRKLYRIDYDALDERILQSTITATCGDGETQDAAISTPQNAEMLTENTENTTKNGARKHRAPRALTPLQEEQSKLESIFSELSGLPIPSGKAATIWHITTQKWAKSLNGRSEEIMRAAFTAHTAPPRRLSVKGPQSIDYKFWELAQHGAGDHTRELG